jgi:SAM-dependent methyltransferase
MLFKIKSYLSKKITAVTNPLITANNEVIKEAVSNDPNFSSRLISLAGNRHEFIVDKIAVGDQLSQNPLVVPPPELWEGYAEAPADYLEYGRLDVQKMLAILEKAGENAHTLSKVLDLGCAAGRMLRHYPYYEGKSALWGCDINAHHINWCQQHLSPPFLFATTTTLPHLPFEDNSFDLVYCGSVFTHISDLADAWLLEIRRILRKDGYAFITIHDKHTFRLLLDKYIHQERFHDIAAYIKDFDARTHVNARDFAWFSIGNDPHSQVYYDIGYLQKKWSGFMKFVSVNPETYNYQTALLLQKK